MTKSIDSWEQRLLAKFLEDTVLPEVEKHEEASFFASTLINKVARQSYFHSRYHFFSLSLRDWAEEWSGRNINWSSYAHGESYTTRLLMLRGFIKDLRKRANANLPWRRTA